MHCENKANVTLDEQLTFYCQLSSIYQCTAIQEPCMACRQPQTSAACWWNTIYASPWFIVSAGMGQSMVNCWVMWQLNKTLKVVGYCSHITV